MDKKKKIIIIASALLLVIAVVITVVCVTGKKGDEPSKVYTTKKVEQVTEPVGTIPAVKPTTEISTEPPTTNEDIAEIITDESVVTTEEALETFVAETKLATTENPTTMPVSDPKKNDDKPKSTAAPTNAPTTPFTEPPTTMAPPTTVEVITEATTVPVTDKKGEELVTSIVGVEMPEGGWTIENVFNGDCTFEEYEANKGD